MDWCSVEIPNYPIHNSVKQRVNALCAAARIRINGGVLLEHDTTWDRGGEPTEETVHRYCYLSSTHTLVVGSLTKHAQGRGHATDDRAQRSGVRLQHILCPWTRALRQRL